MVETIEKPEVEAVTHIPPSRITETTIEIGTLTLSRDFEGIVAAIGEIQASINEAGLTPDARNDVLDNPYAKLPAILKALSPHMKEHGVTLLQPFKVDGDTVTVTTILLKGKQYVSMSASMTADSTLAHAIGSATTYCCRYSIRAMLCLAVDGSGDQDDDGNRASGVGGGSNVTSVTSSAVSAAPTAKVSAKDKSDHTGYSEALRGYLKRVETADMAGLTSAEAQVPAFRLNKEEQEILLKAIRERKENLVPPSDEA